LSNTRYCVFHCGGGIALGLLAILAAGCDSIIHKIGHRVRSL